MKKILLASVAAIATAPAAFAFDANSALEMALNAIDDAYEAVDGEVGTNTQTVLDSLVYHIDNHGAVDDITYSAGSFVNGVWTPGALSVTTHDYSAVIGSEVTGLRNNIEIDLFGSAGRDRTDVNVIQDQSGQWTLDASTMGGDVATWLTRDGAGDGSVGAGDDGIVTDLNDLENALDTARAGGFTASDIAAINTQTDRLEATGTATNAALTTVAEGVANEIAGGWSTAPVAAGPGPDGVMGTADDVAAVAGVANYDYAIRPGTYTVTLANPDGNDVQVRPYSSTSDSIVVGSTTHSSYASYVDTFLTSQE